MSAGRLYRSLAKDPVIIPPSLSSSRVERYDALAAKSLGKAAALAPRKAPSEVSTVAPTVKIRLCIVKTVPNLGWVDQNTMRC